ncbi:MAG: hypothetical protein CME65_02310 [Halobacteriovoraceae bacterium]|nr:hypothetical protein [Halobacteriovoraceae bacterium]|tara:strand:+ start:4618 stop:4881 length:264 start_codon:yes stop_codon:yes gene_type:complete
MGMLFSSNLSDSPPFSDSEKYEVINLNTNPDLYAIEKITLTTDHQFPVALNAGSEPINSSDTVYLLHKPGTYQLQYLGACYGWLCQG